MEFDHACNEKCARIQNLNGFIVSNVFETGFRLQNETMI